MAELTYRIKNWNETFEKSDTRKCKSMRWAAIPNKHDGKSFRRIAKLPNNTDVFTAWVLIVQLASKMPVRGVLADRDGPLTAEDMADKTGFPEEMFKAALPILAEPRIGWLESCNGKK